MVLCAVCRLTWLVDGRLIHPGFSARAIYKVKGSTPAGVFVYPGPGRTRDPVYPGLGRMWDPVIPEVYSYPGPGMPGTRALGVPRPLARMREGDEYGGPV